MHFEVWGFKECVFQVTRGKVLKNTVKFEFPRSVGISI